MGQGIGLGLECHTLTYTHISASSSYSAFCTPTSSFSSKLHPYTHPSMFLFLQPGCLAAWPPATQCLYYYLITTPPPPPFYLHSSIYQSINLHVCIITVSIACFQTVFSCSPPLFSCDDMSVWHTAHSKHPGVCLAHGSLKTATVNGFSSFLKLYTLPLRIYN